MRRSLVAVHIGSAGILLLAQAELALAAGEATLRREPACRLEAGAP